MDFAHPFRLLRFACAVLLLAVASTAQAGSRESWVEVKSPHFLAVTDAGEKKAGEILTQFEGIREAFLALFPNLRVDPPRQVLVVVTRDEDTMKRFLPKGFQGKDPVRPAGFYLSGPDRIYALVRLDAWHQAEHPYHVLFHEYAHLIIHLNFPGLPTWMNEGLADFYGATRIQADRILVGKVPRGHYARLNGSGFLSLETLLSVTHDSPHYNERGKAGLFYAQSWALVHLLYLEERAQKAGLMSKYLKAIEGKQDPVAAGREAFGNLELFLPTLVAYSRQTTFRFLVAPLKVKLAEKDFGVRSMDPVEPLVIQAEVLTYGREPKEAVACLQQAIALAPRFPGVLVAKGLAQYLQGEQEPARTSLEEAQRLGSKDFRVPLYLARLAREGRGSTETDRGRILGWLEETLRLAPDCPDAHMHLSQELIRDPFQQYQAIMEGRRAVALDPRNLAYRASLGTIYLRFGREEEARAVAVQLDRLARTPAEKAIAASYAGVLARSQEAKQAPPTAVAAAASADGPPKPFRQVIPGRSIRFSVPDHMIPFGREILELFSAGKTDEAIQKVKDALATTRSKADRKALEGILAQLREPAANHG
jgi:Flp pilus assembly protein TadD